MLQLELKSREFYDERTNKFFTIKGRKLMLEHSLVSISKWESDFHKAFFSKDPMTDIETRNYVKCMTITQNIPDETYFLLTDEDVAKVNDYINENRTASKIKVTGRRNDGQYVTSELIYSWMIEFGIPMECQKWHFSRLWALIAMCSEQRKPRKKVPKAKGLSDMVRLNEQRLRNHSKVGRLK